MIDFLLMAFVAFGVRYLVMDSGIVELKLAFRLTVLLGMIYILVTITNFRSLQEILATTFMFIICTVQLFITLYSVADTTNKHKKDKKKLDPLVRDNLVVINKKILSLKNKYFNN